GDPRRIQRVGKDRCRATSRRWRFQAFALPDFRHCADYYFPRNSKTWWVQLFVARRRPHIYSKWRRLVRRWARGRGSWGAAVAGSVGSAVAAAVSAEAAQAQAGDTCERENS